jgi:TatD DNase family protein
VFGKIKMEEKMMIFDTHAHYDDPAFAGGVDDIVAHFPAAGIGRAVNVASTRESIPACLALAARYPVFYAAAGIHPSECTDITEADIEIVRRALALPRTVAVGEIGLDYHWPEPERKLQQKWFAAQLELAAEEDVPVIVHSRDAAADTMDMIRQHSARKRGDNPAGVIHCYSYGREQAEEYCRMGWMIGVGGVVTFRNARKLKETVQAIPLEAIVLETDCPYMAPEPHRGERNSSLFLPLVVKAVADLKNVTPEEVIAQTERNAERLYRL